MKPPACDLDPTRTAADISGSIADIIDSKSRPRADIEPLAIGSSRTEPIPSRQLRLSRPGAAAQSPNRAVFEAQVRGVQYYACTTFTSRFEFRLSTGFYSADQHTSV